MSNILILLPVAQFIQTGERTNIFEALPKKARRKADGVRNAVLFGQMALVWDEAEEDRNNGCCQITGLVGKCNMFSLKPLEIAAPKVESLNVSASQVETVPEHDFIDLKLVNFVSSEEAENYGSSDESEYVVQCAVGFDVLAFREDTGLSNAALNFQQVSDITKSVANSSSDCAVIQYSIITVFN